MRFTRARQVLTFVVALAALVKTINAQDDDCSLYLGESTIKNAGWGVFAGRAFKPGDQVGPVGIGIQIVDPEKIFDDGPLHNFLWRSWIAGGVHEADSVRTFLPGVGSLANYHPLKKNVVEGGFQYTPQFDRKSDPQVGSNTDYHNFSFIATEDINTGDEIFVGFGELERSDPQYADLPTWRDYDRADRIIDDLKKYHEIHPELSQTQWIDILYRIKNEMMQKTDKSLKLIPDSFELLRDIVTSGLGSSGLIERDFHEIRKDGLCLDLIREGPSTISKAGRGAFATKSISKGSLISPAPLLHIANSTSLRSKHGHDSQQLLLNYCFGHDKSDMLFCPLSHVALINHKSDGANAELRWGKTSSNRLGDENFLTGPPDRLRMKSTELATSGSRLMLEIVATKDLQPGDEILLDYGTSWETAYTQHVKSWAPIDDAFVPASIKNEEEWEIVADPSSAYECLLEPMPDERRPEIRHEDYRSYGYHNFATWNDDMQLFFGRNSHVAWFPCEITGVDDVGSYQGNVYSKSLEMKQLIRIFHSIPREAIRFVDKSYQSNQHIFHSFRHYIPMANNIFPTRWRTDYRAALDFQLGVVDQGVDASKSENAHILQEHERKLREAKCGLYFAPSNIPGAGFSSYTAVPYVAREITIGTEMSAIVIPYAYEETFTWDIVDYVWDARSYNAEYEIINTNRGTEVLGVSLANFHPSLVNMRAVESKFKPTLDSCKDPGAGAFSDYVGCAFVSEQVLEPGEELFVSYGETWFTARKEFHDVPLSRNYEDANRMVASIMSLIDMSELDMNPSAITDLLELVKKSIIDDHRTQVAMSRIKTPSQIKQVIERNGTAKESMALRSMEWFEEHGQCMDHVYYKDSTFPQAGKGAFSRRALKHGTTIISSPLILTWGDSPMTLRTGRGAIPGGINTRLILENYQFKHPSADVYFLPITQMTAINHGSPREESRHPPNAKIQWAQWHRKSLYYLQRPLDDLRNEHHSTMVFDVVASRDISVDEEILIDYGEEWELAWANHTKNFESPCEGRDKLSSLAVYNMNLDKFNTKFHNWSKDHFTVCRQWRSSEKSDSKWIYLADKSSKVLVNGMEFEIETSFKGINWNDEGFLLIQDLTERIPCKILSASANGNELDVVYFRRSISTFKGLEKVQRLELRSRIPPSEVEFINKPFTSDMHLPRAFRHPIKIPDNIFPPHWNQVKN